MLVPLSTGSFRLFGKYTRRMFAFIETEEQAFRSCKTVCCPADAPPYLTLRRLSVWLAEPIARFRWLAAAADVCSGMRGGALLSALESLGQHGDPFVGGLFRRALNVVGRPLFEMIAAWVFEGRLDGAEGEFFIQPTAGGAAGRCLEWCLPSVKPEESFLKTYPGCSASRGCHYLARLLAISDMHSAVPVPYMPD